jgi:hypothetical protein
MKEFYKKFIIPNYNSVVKELIGAIEHDFIRDTKVNSWIYPVDQVLEKCPHLNEFLKPRLKKPLEQIKYYCTPSKRFLGAHVDGATVKVPFGMNIPLMNTKDTSQLWFNCPPENTMTRTISRSILRDEEGFLSEVHVPKDPTIMPVIKTLELDTPAITKTDIMHSVSNPTNNTRLIVVLRWNLSEIDYSEPEDVIDLEDLYV